MNPLQDFEAMEKLARFGRDLHEAYSDLNDGAKVRDYTAVLRAICDQVEADSATGDLPIK